MPRKHRALTTKLKCVAYYITGNHDDGTWSGEELRCTPIEGFVCATNDVSVLPLPYGLLNDGKPALLSPPPPHGSNS